MYTNDKLQIINDRLHFVEKICKYDPECGHMWPEICRFGKWDRHVLLHSSDTFLEKVLFMLDDMYGETMVVSNGAELDFLYLDFLVTDKTLVL